MALVSVNQDNSGRISSSQDASLSLRASGLALRVSLFSFALTTSNTRRLQLVEQQQLEALKCLLHLRKQFHEIVERIEKLGANLTQLRMSHEQVALMSFHCSEQMKLNNTLLQNHAGVISRLVHHKLNADIILDTVAAITSLVVALLSRKPFQLALSILVRTGSLLLHAAGGRFQYTAEHQVVVVKFALVFFAQGLLFVHTLRLVRSKAVSLGLRSSLHAHPSWLTSFKIDRYLGGTVGAALDCWQLLFGVSG